MTYPIFSIGYGNRSWPQFSSLLRERNCDYLIDVRSNPYSKFNPDFSQQPLRAAALADNIRYVFMGDLLGGKPNRAEDYLPDGRVDYIRQAESPAFQQGLARLRSAHSQSFCVCLMCSELRPEECHRCKLIGEELAQLSIDIVHIDEKGHNISQAEAIKRLDGGQNDFFGTPQKLTTSRGAYRK